MVRHHFAASPISAAAGRMGETAIPARLIPPGNIPTALGTGDTRATFSTINLPAVAASADQHLAPTTLAQKEASGIMLICSMAVVMTWTRSPICAIITRHSCSARCRARRRVDLAVQSALCLPSSIFTKITADAAAVPVLTPSPEPLRYISRRQAPDLPARRQVRGLPFPSNVYDEVTAEKPLLQARHRISALLDDRSHTVRQFCERAELLQVTSQMIHL